MYKRISPINMSVKSEATVDLFYLGKYGKMQTRKSCEISSSHGGEYDVQSCLLGYTAGYGARFFTSVVKSYSSADMLTCLQKRETSLQRRVMRYSRRHRDYRKQEVNETKKTVTTSQLP
jgi:hypothetical protein